MKTKATIPSLALLILAVLSAPVHADTLPDPDGRPADMSKPVQVYILMGQSNMLGFGDVSGGADGDLDYAVKNKRKYPYLVDGRGNWTTRMDVRHAHVQGSGGPTAGTSVLVNDWLTATSRNRIGPEQGIGHHLGTAIDAPVLILKSCIGNRSLGWDLLPPGSARYEHESGGTTYIYAGYGDSPDKWPKGTRPTPIGWQAGIQYDGDIARARHVLNNLGTYYPGATDYEIAGFFWWQGDKDRYDGGHAGRYEQNLVQLIEQLRLEFDAPDAKFVCATLGQSEIGVATGTDKTILEAQLAVSDATKYPQFDGNVATVYSHPLSMGGASNSHYGGNAETYMNIGEAMGQAMVDLINLNSAKFASWVANYTLIDSSFDGDDDNDRLPNAIEALFGTAPDVGNVGLSQVGRSGNTVTFTHPNPDPADVVLDVDGSYEWSPNLADWYQTDGVAGPGGTTVTVSATPDSPSDNVTTVVATVAGTTPSMLYLRVVATLN